MVSTKTERIRAAISRIYSDKKEDFEGVIDLLTDLRHFCDTNDLDFAALDRRAYEHYVEEKFEERNDDEERNESKSKLRKATTGTRGKSAKSRKGKTSNRS